MATTQNSINNLLATTALTGVLQAAQHPALTGDVTSSAGSLSVTVTALRGHAVKNATPTDAQLLVWNNTNSDWEPASISGDITITNAGAATIANNAVTTAKINANAVSNAKMATGTTNSLAGYDGSGNFSGVTVGGGLALSGGTLSASASAYYSYNTISGTTQSMSADVGYIPTNAALTTLTLPSTAAVGDHFKIVGYGAGGWTLAQNASQVVNFGNAATTTGTGGSIASQNRYDSIELVCVVANTTFVVVSSQGNMTVT